jgi:hypothetical protein
VKNAPLEKTIVAAIMRALKERGVWAVKTHGGQYQVSGLPDIIAIAPGTGRFLGIEVKRPGVGRLTDLQKITLSRINEHGGIAGVAYSVEDALQLLDQANRRDENAD